MTALTDPYVGVPDLLARYALSMDDRRLDDCLALFTDDAALTVNGNLTEGKAAIRDWMQTLAANPAGKHLTTNVAVTPHGADRATSVADLAFLRRGDDGRWALYMAGRYEDDIVLRDREWRFARRDILMG